jgi:hypothetical protein
MVYQEWGSGPPHFDGKNYHMWQMRMAPFLHSMGQILWDVTVNTAYVHSLNFHTPGSRDMFDTNNKVVNYLYPSLCESEFEQVRTEDLACRIWEQLKNAHVGNAQVQARLFVSYRREYENFTHLPGESIDAMFQCFTVIVNNMRANVVVLPYDDHDRAIKLLHSLDCTVWGGKVEAILESEKYETRWTSCSPSSSSEVDRGMRAKIENPTDPRSLALVSGSRTNANMSSRHFSLSCFVSMPDEEFDVLGEEDLALLSRRLERMYMNQKNAQRSSGMCYRCGKHGHFIAECPEAMEVKPEHKHRPRTDHKHRSRDDYKGKNKSERRPRKSGGHKKNERAMVAGASDIDSSSWYSSSSSSDEEENRHKGKRSNKNINGLCFATQGFCGVAHSSASKKSNKDNSGSDSEEEVNNDPSFLIAENSRLNDLLDNRDDVLRKTNKEKREYRSLLGEAKEKVVDLESFLDDARAQIDSLKSAPILTNEPECNDCSTFLGELTVLKEKYASKVDELDVLKVELDEVKSRPSLLGACTSCPVLHEKLDVSLVYAKSLEAQLKAPIPTICSTCEINIVKNMELAHYVDRLQDENDELRKMMGLLSGHEPQLRIMIETYKCQDGEVLGANKVGEGSGENEGKIGDIPEPPKTHHKNAFVPKPNHLRNRLDTTPAPPVFPPQIDNY